MLLHWFELKDTLWVFIQPQRLVLLRITRTFNTGFKQQVVHKQVIELTEKITDYNLESQEWKTLIKRLSQVLDEPRWQSTRPIAVISNHFARFAVIPWNAELAIETERQAYMQHCFKFAYGESVNGWDLRLSEPDFGCPALASGVDHTLLQLMQGVFAEANLKLTAVHPQLMLVINQAFNEIKNRDKQIKQKETASFWLIAIQDKRLCILLMLEGDWQLVKNVAQETDVSVQVTALIQRERVNRNIHEVMPVLLYWPEFLTEPINKSNQPIKLASQLVNEVINVPAHPFDMQNSQHPHESTTWALT